MTPTADVTARRPPDRPGALSGPLAPSLSTLAAAWRAQAAELRAFAAEAQAVTLERAAAQLDAALQRAADEALTLEEAARASGYSPDHLRHLIADGEIPNAGKRGAPRVRRADLPRKVSAPRPAAAFDPDRFARGVVRLSSSGAGAG